MVDTLRLNLIDCEIKKTCPLQAQHGVIDHSSGAIINEFDLFVNTEGQIVRGNKAFFNDEKFNLTISPTVYSEVDENTGLTHLRKTKFSRMEGYQKDLFGNDIGIEDEVKGIFVQTSLPRLLSKNNYKTLSFDEQKTALKVLQDRLKSNGIKTNIFNANLSRLDTFTNIPTDHIFFSYSNLFSLMECSRMKSIDWNNESFLWKNGQQELMIYDKIREMKFKNPKSRIRTKKNIMRFENRLPKKRKIIASTNFETVEDMYKNYDELKDFHKKEVEKKIFKYSYDEIESLTENDLRLKFINAKKLYGKRWFNGYCFNFGVYTISKIVDLDFMKTMIDEIDNGTPVQMRVKKHRIKKAMEESKFYFGNGGVFSDELANFKSNVDLYNELKTKFYKIAA